jgi:putative Holliday junction resolvase
MSRELPATGALAGIDYGTVRIGVAICDPGRTLASPHENYVRRGEVQDAAYFRRLVEQERIAGFVVGLPVYASGEESAASAAARQFGKWLAETTGKPVRFFDERYTSAQAEQLLGAAGMTKKQKKQRLDKLAAQLILAAYLESFSGGQPAPLDNE